MQGIKNGKGVYQYNNGDIYEGNFEQDKKTDSNCIIRFAKSKSIY